jgi:hypothetical protein
LTSLEFKRRLKETASRNKALKGKMIEQQRQFSFSDISNNGGQSIMIDENEYQNDLTDILGESI